MDLREFALYSRSSSIGDGIESTGTEVLSLISMRLMPMMMMIIKKLKRGAKNPLNYSRFQ